MVGPLASTVVIVTGGATGIGQAEARRVVSEGAAAVFGSGRRDVGEQVAAEIRLTQLAVAEFGRLDGAVNNAGGVHAAGPVHAIDGSAWQADLAQSDRRPQRHGRESG